MSNPHRVVRTARLFLVVSVAVVAASSASAQDRGIEAGMQLAVLPVSAIETTDVGIGASVAWPVTPVVSIDGSLTWFPEGDREEDGLEQKRVLGLGGVRFLTTRAKVDLFAATRIGFLRFAEANPAICIAIFPPPFACRLVAGYTALALNVGAGASVGVAKQGRLRAGIEVGDVMVGYNFDAVRPGGEVTDGFISHNLLLTLGLRWRF